MNAWICLLQKSSKVQNENGGDSMAQISLGSIKRIEKTAIQFTKRFIQLIPSSKQMEKNMFKSTPTAESTEKIQKKSANRFNLIRAPHSL